MTLDTASTTSVNETHWEIFLVYGLLIVINVFWSWVAYGDPIAPFRSIFTVISKAVKAFIQYVKKHSGSD